MTTTPDLIAAAELVEDELEAPIHAHKACMDLAKFARKNFRVDGHRKISYDWLIDNRFIDEDDGSPIELPITRYEGPKVSVGWSGDCCFVSVRNTEDKQGPITLLEPNTRGQLLSLLAALGMEVGT